MGKWFAEFGKERGWEVVISDIDHEKAEKVAKELSVRSAPDNETAVKDADIVLVSVPLGETPDVVKGISEFLSEGTLLMDIASVKEGTVSAMKEITGDFELVSLHPLFGPGAESLKGKNVVSIRVSPGEKYENFENILREEGAQVVGMGAKEHDRMMSTVQSLTHFTLLSYLSALDSIGDLGENVLQTPMFQRLFEISKAYLREDPQLFADIQEENEHSSEARKSLIRACQDLDSALDVNDFDSIEEVFDRLVDSIGSEEVDKAYKSLYKDMEEE